MNLKAITAMGLGLLAVAGLPAQDISIEDDTRVGLDRTKGLVAPQRPMLVLHVPVSLQNISVEVDPAYVYCEIDWYASGEGSAMKEVYKAVQLTEGAFDGVITFNIRDDEDDRLYPEMLYSYACDLVLCADQVINSDYVDEYPALPHGRRCRRPSAPEEGGERDELVIRADPTQPFSSGVNGSLQD